LNIVTSIPADCSESTFDAFLKLVAKGGEVIGNNLKKRIKKAKLLAFCHDGNQLVGVGAIKNPSKKYKENTFIKAGHPEEGGNFKYEFGYLYVEEKYREQGV
jgi:hypothetical protein